MATAPTIRASDPLNFNHGDLCRCHKCMAVAMGSWIDSLAEKTSTGHWQIFGTATFRTPQYPWQKGFPLGGSYKPNSHFVHRTYQKLVSHLENGLNTSMDYVVADQLGAMNGRLHQHFILAARGLDHYPRTQIWNYLFELAGFNRILPFERGAAYYVGRYIGRKISDCEWDIRLASSPPVPPMPRQIGRTDVVRSTEMPKEAFKNTRKEWHR
jgi:hypothetical protein